MRMFRPIYWPVLLSLVFLNISSKTRLYPNTSSTECTTSTECSGMPMPPHRSFFLRTFLFFQSAHRLTPASLTFFFLFLICNLPIDLLWPHYRSCSLIPRPCALLPQPHGLFPRPRSFFSTAASLSTARPLSLDHGLFPSTVASFLDRAAFFLDRAASLSTAASISIARPLYRSRCLFVDRAACLFDRAAFFFTEAFLVTVQPCSLTARPCSSPARPLSLDRAASFLDRAASCVDRAASLSTPASLLITWLFCPCTDQSSWANIALLFFVNKQLQTADSSSWASINLFFATHWSQTAD